jgi:toxin ParE1/3/4
MVRQRHLRTIGKNGRATLLDGVSNLRVNRHPFVIDEDLPAIYSYIADDDPSAAERWLAAVEKTLDQIGQFPECGVAYRTRSRKLSGIRMLPVSGFTDYLIFYRVESGIVRLLHVVRGNRHLPLAISQGTTKLVSYSNFRQCVGKRATTSEGKRVSIEPGSGRSGSTWPSQ